MLQQLSTGSIQAIQERWALASSLDIVKTEQICIIQCVRNRGIPHDYFTALFRMGLDSVPRFNSGTAIYGEDKIIKIYYENPFFKGLGIIVKINKLNKYSEKCYRLL